MFNGFRLFVTFQIHNFYSDITDTEFLGFFNEILFSAFCIISETKEIYINYIFLIRFKSNGRLDHNNFEMPDKEVNK